MAGSHDDAVLMVELAKWGAMIGLAEASRKIYADDFDPDGVEANDPAVQTHLFFNETVGTLVRTGSSTGTWCTTGSGLRGHGIASALPQKERGRRRASLRCTKTSRRSRRVSVSVAGQQPKHRRTRRKRRRSPVRVPPTDARRRRSEG
jgi:hypothetical protein